MRRPSADPQQTLPRRVNLVDEREEMAPVLPMDLVDADGANSREMCGSSNPLISWLPHVDDIMRAA
jgi:hypothetical protein